MDIKKYDLTEKEKNLVEMPHPISLKWYEDADERYYVASIPMLKGCMSDGATVKEALENIIDAKVSWITALLEFNNDIPIPENSKPIIEILQPYSKDEIKDMESSYEKMKQLIKEFNEKYENVVFINQDY